MARRVSLTTTDHDTIRRWAEERGGKPSEVIATAREGDVGIIRIDFPGYSGEGRLREISWNDWFDKFDAASLAFICEEQTASGQRSNFNKLVGRETAAARAQGKKASRRTSARKPKRTSEPRRRAARAEAGRTARTRRPARSASHRPTVRRRKKPAAMHASTIVVPKVVAHKKRRVARRGR